MRSLVCGGRPGFNAASGEGGRDSGGVLNAADTHLSLIKFTTLCLVCITWKPPGFRQRFICAFVFLSLCTCALHQRIISHAPPFPPSIPYHSATMSVSASPQHLFSACMHFLLLFFLTKTLKERWYMGIKVGNTQHKNGRLYTVMAIWRHSVTTLKRRTSALHCWPHLFRFAFFANIASDHLEAAYILSGYNEGQVCPARCTVFSYSIYSSKDLCKLRVTMDDSHTTGRV